MDKLQIFEHPQWGKIRTLEINSEPWLAGKDVATALGYANPSKAVMNHVDGEDKRFEMLLVSDSQNGNLVKTAFINESGLYSLIFSSKLPGAKKFKRWVTSEVLPAIRKTGTYTMLPAETQSAPHAPVEQRTLTTDDYIVAARLISDCRNERLPYVIGLLERGGFEIPEVEKLPRSLPQRKSAVRVQIEKTSSFINLDDFL